MDGFLDGKPLLVKVTFTPDEVPLLNGTAYPHGLLAEVATADGRTRWFVPWSSVIYLKQEQSIAEQGGAKPNPGQSTGKPANPGQSEDAPPK